MVIASFLPDRMAELGNLGVLLSSRLPASFLIIHFRTKAFQIIKDELVQLLLRAIQ